MKTISSLLKIFCANSSRFVEADEEFIEELRNTSENKKTKRSTDYWTNIFQQWAKPRGKHEQLESYEVPELNESLAQCFAELRKENGKDYEPDSTLKVIKMPRCFELCPASLTMPLQCNAQHRWKPFFTIKSQSEQVR